MNMVGADGADEINLALAADADHLRSEGFGKLHRVGPDPSGGPDDQHPLSGLNAPSLQTLYGGQPGDRDDRRLLEADAGGFVDEVVLPGRRVLGEGPSGDAETPHRRAETWSRGSRGDDQAGDVQPGDALLRTAEPEPMTRIR
jgi:hypothetical protein